MRQVHGRSATEAKGGLQVGRAALGTGSLEEADAEVALRTQ